MPRSSLDNWSSSSSQSGTTLRSGSSLAEKMRKLGFNVRSERGSKLLPLHQMNLKFEENRPSDYVIMVPNINLEQIIYFQPDVEYDKKNPKKILYKFEDFYDIKNSKEIRRISDIEVVSYKPARTMIFKKKKKHSSIINTVETILYKNKGPLPVRDPSEESLLMDQRTEPEKTIHDLPENILLKIFKYFSQKERNLQLALVCKSWYNITNDPIFWNELVFKGSKVSKKIIIKLIRRHPSVRKLSLISLPDIVEILQELCRCNHSITYLKVRHCVLGSQDFARIILHVISCCTNLETLDLKGMRFQSDRFFLELGRLKNLKSINLTGNNMVKNQNLVTLSINCRSLRELKILDIFSNKENNFPLRDSDVIYIVLHLQTNLETLEIDMQQLKTVSYEAIIKCTKLKNLTLKNCLYLSGEIFRQFPKLENLQKLKLTRGINIGSHDFQFVFGSEKMSQIEELDLNGCWRVGEIGLEAITHRLSALKFLSLKNCKTISEPQLRHLSLCPELIHLNIAHTGIELKSPESLFNNAKKLETLVIDNEMSKNSTIQKLKKLYPSLQITVSYSEFKKDERPLEI